MHPRSAHRFRSLLLALALLLTSSITRGVDVKDGPLLAITFIEVRVEARGHVAGALRQPANASREHQPSPGQIISLQEISRPERFVVLEREASAQLTGGGWETPALTEELADDLTAPPDERLNRVFDATSTAAGTHVDTRANFYVITHVDIATRMDVTTPDQSRVDTALRKLAAAARHSDGNLGFEILQQINRPNHFNLISAWLGEFPFHAFASSAPAREFRQTIGPFLGSPYDERLFRRVD